MKDIYMKKDCTSLIKVYQEIWNDDANIDFINKDTELVIESFKKK